MTTEEELKDKFNKLTDEEKMAFMKSVIPSFCEIFGKNPQKMMADGEDGFGPPATVYNTLGAFLDVGVSGINLEDQILPRPLKARA
jgi:2-methylisocitrate lyase-like PEP mutase family enzyme